MRKVLFVCLYYVASLYRSFFLLTSKTGLVGNNSVIKMINVSEIMWLYY